MAKSQTFKEEIYPEDFDDDNKLNFDVLLAQALNIYPNIELWIMKLAIVAHINKEKGKGIPLDKEEAEKLRKRYLNIQPIYETPAISEEQPILTNK